jgi:hypothetical protein
MMVIQRSAPQSGQMARYTACRSILTSAILHQRYHHRFHAISGHTPLMVNDGIRNIQTAWFDASV